MPVSPELALTLAKETLSVYTEAEEILLAKVARRLARGIEEPGWAEHKLAEIQDLRRDTQRDIARLARRSDASIARAVRTAYNRGIATAGTDLRAFGTRAAIAFGATDEAQIRALIRSATQTVSATHLRILRSTLDVYRDTVAQAAAQVLTGSQTRREAAQGVLNRFAERGITGFIDSGGRSWDLASYAETATRTASGHAAVQGHIDRLQQAGHDLVIVSDAPEECKVCRPWEGKVLSISGRDKNHTSLSSATISGLFHANCRHSTGIYIPGVTRPFTNTADPVGAAQRETQRYLERGVRSWDRRVAAAMSPEAEAAAKAKASEWRSRIKSFTDEHDRKRLRHRETLGAR